MFFLLVRVFRPLTLKVIIDRYTLIPVLLLVFWLLLEFLFVLHFLDWSLWCDDFPWHYIWVPFSLYVCVCVFVCVCIYCRFWFLVVKVKLAQSCPILCDCMDCSPPGSSVHGILQARILECIVNTFSRDLLGPEIKLRTPALQADSVPSEAPFVVTMRIYSHLRSNTFKKLYTFYSSPPHVLCFDILCLYCNYLLKLQLIL